MNSIYKVCLMPLLLIGYMSMICSTALYSADDNPKVTICENGLLIECSRNIPKNFAYKIQKQDAQSGAWRDIAFLKFDNNANNFFKYLQAKAAEINYNSLPDDINKSAIWSYISTVSTTDSVPFYGSLPLYQVGMRTAYLDTEAELGKSYTYRYSIISPENKEVFNSNSVSLSYTQSISKMKFTNMKAEAYEQYISLKFLLNTNLKFYRFRIFRSIAMQTDFEEIFVNSGISNRGDSLIVGITDTNVFENGKFLYYIVPYDIYGIAGNNSDTVTVNNTFSNSKSMLNSFVAESDKNKHSINLKWNLKQNADLVGINIYKSKIYNLGYELLVSLPKSDTTYQDGDVEPIQTYFYYIETQTIYGVSEKSTRIIGMLEADRAAFAPNNFSAEIQQNNIIKLSWQQPSHDIKSYRIYRGISPADSDLVEIRHIVADSTIDVVCYDTLNTNSFSSYYYAVKSENSSYSISPCSEIVPVSVQNTNYTIPAPMNLNGQISDKAILLVWDNMKDIDFDNRISSYKVYRQTLNNGEVDSSKLQILGNPDTELVNNYYEDKYIEAGKKYLYSVKAIGYMGNESSLSAPITIEVPLIRPLSISNVSVISNESGKFSISWNKTSQANVRKYIIYRILTNNKATPTMLAELDADTNIYEDSIESLSSNVFYTVTCVSAEGIESTIDEWFGVK